jgi:hypothetical protein
VESRNVHISKSQLEALGETGEQCRDLVGAIDRLALRQSLKTRAGRARRLVLRGLRSRAVRAASELRAIGEFEPLYGVVFRQRGDRR